ncbi:E3 ubiquitin-protein ligase rad18 [Mortierella sp. NVP85]|nr:E3 ubiquitin-protein ligase rad18 [Mortierella sp. NVP85]
MRRNVALDEIANSFKDCRSTLLKTVMDSLKPRNSGPPELTRMESMEVDDLNPVQKKRRISSRVTRKTSSQSGNHEAGEGHSANDDEKDDDFVMHPQESSKGMSGARSTKGSMVRSRGKNADQSIGITAPATTRPFTSSALAQPDLRSLVPCPICQMAVPEAYTNIHLDKYCLKGQQDPAYNIAYTAIGTTLEPSAIELYERQGSSKQNVVGAIAPSSSGSPQRNTTTNIFDGSGSSRNLSPLQNRTQNLTISGTISRLTYPEPKRIAKLAYSVLTEKQLRKKLQELGLATNGDKQLMMKRHAEYVTIFNANCDATRPQTTAQLMKAMERWERINEQDTIAKEAQKRTLEAQQRKHQMELALKKTKAAEQEVFDVTVDENTEDTVNTTTPPSSQGSASNGSGSSSNGPVLNHANNTEIAVAVAGAAAFSHAQKYAEEYAELIADVKRRLQADKEKKALVEKEAIAKRQGSQR